MVNKNTEWIRCPVCGNKTRLQIREDAAIIAALKKDRGAVARAVHKGKVKDVQNRRLSQGNAPSGLIRSSGSGRWGRRSETCR